MGIYVQEESRIIQLVFSGPWADPITKDVKVIQHQSMVTLVIPFVLAQQTTPSPIFVSLPSDLIPKNFLQHTYLAGLDEGVGAPPADEIAVVAAVLPAPDPLQPPDANLIFFAERNEGSFTGTGEGGIRAVHLTYCVS